MVLPFVRLGADGLQLAERVIVDCECGCDCFEGLDLRQRWKAGRREQVTFQKHERTEL
jgi:hypothetical protein